MTLSRNKVIDNFIRCTYGRMRFVSYNKFKDVEFIAEGGFSKVYKAIWIDSSLTELDEGKKQYSNCNGKIIIAFKELSNSKNISSSGLNEVNIYVIFDLI